MSGKSEHIDGVAYNPASSSEYITLVGGVSGGLAKVIALDAAGNLNSFATPSISKSTALENSRIVKAAPGAIRQITGFNNGPSDQYILVFNTTTIPANGSIPECTPILAPAGSNFNYDFNAPGRPLTVGICICNSSTLATKTIGAANCWFEVQYF